jgi:hypothetical protein
MHACMLYACVRQAVLRRTEASIFAGPAHQFHVHHEPLGAVRGVLGIILCAAGVPRCVIWICFPHNLRNAHDAWLRACSSRMQDS